MRPNYYYEMGACTVHHLLNREQTSRHLIASSKHKHVQMLEKGCMTLTKLIFIAQLRLAIPNVLWILEYLPLSLYSC